MVKTGNRIHHTKEIKMNDKRDTGLTDQERADMLREAQDKLVDAIDLIEVAVRGTRREDYTDAYVTSHLKIMATEGHGYLSRDTNLDDMIRWFEDEDDD